MFDLFVDGKYIISGHTDFLDLFLIGYLVDYRVANPCKHVKIEYIYNA
ncbi:Protein of unknown function [Bacillus cereus]|nr:Protein of unknown function [Bacillus cereus]